MALPTCCNFLSPPNSSAASTNFWVSSKIEPSLKLYVFDFGVSSKPFFKSTSPAEPPPTVGILLEAPSVFVDNHTKPPCSLLASYVLLVNNPLNNLLPFKPKAKTFSFFSYDFANSP